MRRKDQFCAEVKTGTIYHNEHNEKAFEENNQELIIVFAL